MASHNTQEPGRHTSADVSRSTLYCLEWLDNVAHIVVAIFFILMAATVLIYCGLIFARQIPLIATARATEVRQAAHQTARTDAPVAPAAESPAASGKPAAEEMDVGVTDPFLHNSLELLSSLLFVVILLELLRTIITYLQTRDIQAIMKEFLVVGIISSVRKILLVGAESSLSSSKGSAFIEEASGTVISIVGILLLILGLIMLERHYGGKHEAGMDGHAADAHAADSSGGRAAEIP